MATEVGSGQVSIVPTFKGFRKAVTEETDASAKQSASGFQKLLSKAGITAGKQTGQGFQKAFDSTAAVTGSSATKKLTSEVAVASRALSAARLKDQDAAGKVRVAEAQLAEARTKGTAESARVVAAEEKLAAAQRAQSASSDTAVAATARLKAAQAGLAAETAAASTASARSSRSLLGGIFSKGAQLGSSAGRTIGGGFAHTFKTALAPIAGIAAGYVGFQLLERGFDSVIEHAKEFIGEMADLQVVNAQSNAVVKSTGGVANVTAKQMHALAQRIQDVSGTTDDEIQSGANMVATFTNIRNAAGKGNDIFNQTVHVSTDVARALGKSVPAAALVLSKALNDPAAGVTKLTRIGVTFSAQQKDQIATLTKSGKTLEAQKVILKELNREFGGSAAAYGKTLPGALAIFQDSVRETGVKLTSGLSKPLVGILKIATKAVEKFRDSKQFETIVDRLTTKADSFAGKLSKVVGFIEGIGDSGKKITFKDVTAGLANILPTLSPFLTVIGSVGPAISKAFSSAGPSLQKAAAKLAPSLSQLVVAVVPLIPPLTQLAIQAVPLLTDAIEVALPVITPIINWATGFYSALNSLIGLLTGKFSTKQFAAQAMALTGPFGAVTHAAASFGTFLGQTIANVIRAMVNLHNSAASAIGGVVGIFTSLPAKIGKAVSGASGWLVSTGRNVIAGLLNGLRSAGGAIGSYLRGLITKAISSVKGLLGIASPSKVFHQIGAFTGQGLINGLQAKASGAVAAAKGLVSLPAAARAAVSSVAGRGAGMPDEITLVDADGSILTHAKVIAHKVAHAVADARDLDDYTAAFGGGTNL